MINGRDHNQATRPMEMDELFQRLTINQYPLCCVFCKWDLKPGRILPAQGAPSNDAFHIVTPCALHAERLLLKKVAAASAALVIAIESGNPSTEDVQNAQKALLELQGDVVPEDKAVQKDDAGSPES